MWGEADRLIPVEHGRRAHRAMPGSRLEVMPQVGHFPHAEQPLRFSEAVLDFVAATAPARISRRELAESLG